MLFLASMLLFSCNAIYAQVTVGLDEAPEEGALIQLKTISGVTDGSANAYKGLGLPRVELKEINELFPMLTGSELNYGDLKLDHIGLVVYNMTDGEDYCENPDNYLRKGLNVWNGTQWMYIGDNLVSGIGVFTDNRDPANPETYQYMDYGDAGVWMTENMRAKMYADGTPISLYNSSINLPPISPDPYYINVNKDDISTGLTSSTGKKYGLLYNWEAVTRNYVPSAGANVDQHQVQGDVPGPNEVENDANLAATGAAGKRYVQGICPDGWHVPSDREWNQLEEVIYNNPQKYSVYTEEDIKLLNPKTWNNDWEHGMVHYVSVGYRGGDATDPSIVSHGAMLKSVCKLEGSSREVNGKGLAPAQGGFNAILVGYFVGNVSGTTTLTGYGEHAYFWTSSSFNSYVKWMRHLSYTSSGVHRGELANHHFNSVRCKRN